MDSDPQGNAGSGVGINRQKLKVDLMNVLMEGADIRDAVVKTAYKGLDAVGATMGLAGAERVFEVMDAAAETWCYLHRYRLF